jgi:hypothetical protein
MLSGSLSPPAADERDGLQIWIAAANIMNKQWRTADLGVGRGDNNFLPASYPMGTRGSFPGGKVAGA